MPKLNIISLKICDKCKHEFEESASDCPNCHGDSFTTKIIFKRLRIERIYFMIFAAVFVSIVASIIAYFETNKFNPEILLAGILVFSVYAVGYQFLGVKFLDYYSEEETQGKNYENFSRSFFYSEFIYFIIILIATIIIGVILSLLGFRI